MPTQLANERIEHVAGISARLVDILRVENNADALLALFLVLDSAVKTLLARDPSPDVRAELEKIRAFTSAQLWAGAQALFLEDTVQ